MKHIKFIPKVMEVKALHKPIKALYDQSIRMELPRKQWIKIIAIWVIWSLWTSITLFKHWLFIPIVMILMSGIIYWLLKKEIQNLKWTCLQKMKLFFEMMASEISSGQSFNMAMERCIQIIETEKDTPTYLKKSLQRLRKKAHLQVSGNEYFSSIGEELSYPSLVHIDGMISLSLETGVRVDELLSFFAQQMNEDLMMVKAFNSKLSQKRNEFYIMLQVPCLSIWFMESVMEGYFNMLYENSGRVLALFIVAVYMFAMHLYYVNEERLIGKL